MVRWAGRRKVAIVSLLFLFLLAASSCATTRQQSKFTNLACHETDRLAVQILKDLGYTVTGVFDPMPERLKIVAAEKETRRGMYHAHVTITCEREGPVSFVPSQPALAKHDPHFEQEFVAQLEEYLGSGDVMGQVAAPATKEPEWQGQKEKPWKAWLRSRPEQKAESLEPVKVLGVKVASWQEAQETFGVDLSQAKILAIKVTVRNSSQRSFVMAAPLITLFKDDGPAESPLSLQQTTALVAGSPVGRGWKMYSFLQDHYLHDQIIPPQHTVSGYLYYPQQDYTQARIFLIDQQTAKREEFVVTLQR